MVFMQHCHEGYREGNMLMLNKAKSKGAKTWLNRFAEFFDRMFDKFVPKKSAEEDAAFQKGINNMIKDMEDANKVLGLPPLDAKNPYRFL